MGTMTSLCTFRLQKPEVRPLWEEALTTHTGKYEFITNGDNTILNFFDSRALVDLSRRQILDFPYFCCNYDNAACCQTKQVFKMYSCYSQVRSIQIISMNAFNPNIIMII